MNNILDEFQWHSSFPIDEHLQQKKEVRSLVASVKNLKAFSKIRVGSDFLIHKASKALWKMADDGQSIEPVFEEDILTEGDL